MGEYTFHAHTADEKFTAKGKDLEDAFATAVRACAEIMIGETEVTPTKLKKITVTGSKLRSLLYDFLNEIIILLDSDHVLYTEATELTIDEQDGTYTLTAMLAGVPADDVAFRTVIKNMTYSEMTIEQSPDGVRLTVVVDI